MDQPKKEALPTSHNEYKSFRAPNYAQTSGTDEKKGAGATKQKDNIRQRSRVIQRFIYAPPFNLRLAKSSYTPRRAHPTSAVPKSIFKRGEARFPFAIDETDRKTE